MKKVSATKDYQVTSIEFDGMMFALKVNQVQRPYLWGIEIYSDRDSKLTRVSVKMLG